MGFGKAKETYLEWHFTSSPLAIRHGKEPSIATAEIPNVSISVDSQGLVSTNLLLGKSVPRAYESALLDILAHTAQRHTNGQYTHMDIEDGVMYSLKSREAFDTLSQAIDEIHKQSLDDQKLRERTGGKWRLHPGEPLGKGTFTKF